MHVLQNDYEWLLARDSDEKFAHLVEERRLTGTVAETGFRDRAQGRRAIRKCAKLLEEFNPWSVGRGFGSIVALTDEYERSRATRFLADILGQRGLPDTGLAAENNKAALPGNGRAKLRVGKVPLTLAPNQERWAATPVGGAHHRTSSRTLRRNSAFAREPTCSDYTLIAHCLMAHAGSGLFAPSAFSQGWLEAKWASRCAVRSLTWYMRTGLGQSSHRRPLVVGCGEARNIDLDREFLSGAANQSAPHDAVWRCGGFI